MPANLHTEARRLLNAATPGPWFDVNPDDEMCMNVIAIATQKHLPFTEDGDTSGAICVLLQTTPMQVGQWHTNWENDAAFIAFCRNHLGEILDDLAAARGEVERLTACAESAERELADIEDYTTKLWKQVSAAAGKPLRSDEIPEEIERLRRELNEPIDALCEIEKREKGTNDEN